MKCVLRDLIDYSKDGEWGKGQSFEDSEEMLCIRGTDFEATRFGNTERVPQRFIAQRHADRKRLQPWDVLIEAAGGTKDQPTGRTVLLKPSVFRKANLSLTCASFSRLIRFKTDLCDPSFMFWYLQHLYHSGIMRAYHTQHTGVARFQWTVFADNEPLEIPDLPTQRKISGTLSAYDDLIENNLRRIRILEEMAQSLYREWFVHFRFPGHESTQMVDSPLGPIPEGWEVKRLEQVTSKIGSGATPKGGKDAYKAKGMSLIRSLNIFDYEFRHENLAFIDEDQAAKLNNVAVEPYDVLLNITGASVARCSMVPTAVLPARVNQHVAIIRANRESDPFHILDTINSEERKREILALAQGGATREALTKTTVSNLEIVIPDRSTLTKYSNIRRNLFDESQNLAQKNQLLRESRDQILPKMLSKQ